MRTLYLKDSSNRRKQFALITRICVEKGKKFVIKEPCFPEGIAHIKRIAESQEIFAKYYKNVKASKTWIENDMLYAEFIDGIPLSDFYLKAIQNNDRDEIIRLIKFHLELAQGRNNTCVFKETEDFVKIFGETNSFEGELALKFTFFDPLPENIIFINGDINKPCFIDYEWFFDFPVPVSLLKFRIIQQLSMLSGIDFIVSLDERLDIMNCKLSFNESIIFFNKFSDSVYKEEKANYQILNKNFEKNILQYPDINDFIPMYYTLYFDTGNGYSEKEKYSQSFTGNKAEISCPLPEKTVSVRLDPIESYGCVVSNLEILSYNGIVKYEPLNGFTDKNGDMIFVNSDPQIIIEGASYWIKIKYQILLLSEFSHYRVLENYIGTSYERDGLAAERNGLVTERNSLITERDGLAAERNSLIAERDGLAAERNGLTAERDGLVAERNGLISERDWLTAERYGLITERDGLLNSRSWRFTKPLRDIGGFIRRHKVLHLFAKGILSIKRNGIKETLKKVISYNRRAVLSHKLDTLTYESEYQENKDFSKYEPKVKAIAFYLPQFHAILENDKWWGKGFTEWTNTRKAKPLFEGHYQPREPHRDFGYYNLTNVTTLKKQAALAKQHGIYGFCFYLYWFSGKRLLEKPLDLFLAHPEIDINFCLCWANENWTRRWDGQENEILMKQNYSNDDPFRFIDDIQKYIVDRRYIRIDGIPVILAYNPGHIPNVRDVFVKWRNHAEKIGIGKIKIWICKTFGHTPETLHIQDVVDGLVEFPPHGIPYVSTKDINLAEKKAYIYDYKELVFEINKEITSGNKNHESFDKIPLYHTCMLGWDNAARKKNEWSTYAGFSLKVFYEWALLLTRKALKTPNNIFFINAWNEWAEGTYLEPDKKYGYTNINTLSKAIFGLDFNDNNLKQIEKKHNKSIIFVGHDAFNAGAQLLAINIIRQLREIFKYDVYTVLKTGGVLVDDFKTSSTDLIILDDYNMKDFKDWVNSTNTTISICNTVITGDILHILTEYGINCISLIHEMEKIIHQYSCESKLKLIVADALKIVFPSNFVKKSNEKIITIPDEKTIIRPQGLFAINSYMNEHEKIRSIIRIKHNIPQNGKIVLGMGYGDYRKGFDLFLQCMMKVCNVYKDIYFVWVGDIYFNDEALQGYNDIINEYKQNNRLTLPGYVKEYLKYYVAADIFLLTSREDPFPIVVMDAIYANLPVVAFKDGGGYVEIINEKTGILVTMENTDIMSEHICKLLDSDILDKRTINYGYNIIKENFSFVNYLFILLSLLGEQYKKVSVIIPNYNYAKYLKERIDSILSQTFPVYEIIILDDYSTDDSLSVIDEYLKEYPLRIELIKNNENSGNVFKQWEKGIEAAKGDYIWIAEADDLSEPTFLETLINKMSLDESIVIGYTQSKSIDEHGNITGDNYLSYTDKIDTIWRNDYIADGIDEIENRLSVKNTILNVSAVIFKNENLLEIIKNAKNYSVAGDWRFYVDLLMKGGKLLFIADSLNIQRRHENSVTKKLNVKKHFDEICEMQDYIYRITKNRKYFDKAKEYRKEVKEYLRIYE